MKKIKEILCVVMCFTILVTNGVIVSASDTPSSWASDQVNMAISESLVPQNLRSNYTQTINRSEFCALAVSLYEKVKSEITGRSTFSDTNDVNVQKAAYIGVASGVGKNKFDPNGTLTREQAAVMLSRLSDILEQPLPTQANTFADNENISSWAFDEVSRVQAAGIMRGIENGIFAPQDPYTREQSIATIMRMFDVLPKKDLLPPNMTATIISSNNSTKSTRNNYLTGWSVSVPSVQTIVDEIGNTSILDAENAKIYEYNSHSELLRTVTLNKEFETIGSFTKDKNGNYYVFYAQPVSEGAFNEQNMALIKYSSQGNKLNEYKLAAQTTDERWALGYSGVKVPFDSGTCRMEISGHMIAVYFGRIQFVAKDKLNHQASYGFILDIDNFQRLSGKDSLKMPSAGHSFNQFILPVSGGFIFADHGDHGPRSFAFERVGVSHQNEKNESFKFKGGMSAHSSVPYQYTFAEMGGLSKTDSGYLFLGAYEKSTALQSVINDSRNLFILTLSEDLSSVSSPVWLTNYTNKETENAVAPKIVNIGDNKHLVLWENYNTVTTESLTYMTVIDDRGNIITPTKELTGVYLNGYDSLRYNPKTRLVYWSISHGNEIILYSLNPLE